MSDANPVSPANEPILPIGYALQMGCLTDFLFPRPEPSPEED